MQFIFFILIIGILSLLIAKFVADSITRAKTGNAKMNQISQAIRDGSMTFLLREYKVLLWFILAMALVIFFFLDHAATSTINEGPWTAFAFVLGSIASIASGYVGMRIATKANVRTTQAAQSSLKEAFSIAFKSGTVLGFALVGFAVVGMSGLYILFTFFGLPSETVMEVLTGFALGGSSIALFARVGGGIYTKAADLGADIVGKIESGIPEDDPRNPAVIADNVGDNVGDVAGMGADLFGSCAESTCAALVIGALAFGSLGLQTALLYPLAISAIGILVAFLAVRFARLGATENVGSALKLVMILASVLMLFVMYFLTRMWIPSQFELEGVTYTAYGVYGSFALGLVAGLLIGLTTEYFTSHSYKPVRRIAKSSESGAATTILHGIALGYESAVIPVLLIAIVAFLGFRFAGLYGIAIGALGMISTLVVTLAIDGYGPVADNAGGIAEMAGLPSEVRQKTDVLDAAGNTTAAIGKGFAIGSAALTALALFSAFVATAGIELVNLLDNKVIFGLFIGGLLPFIFSSMTIKSVAKAAEEIIAEVRRQFKEIKGLMEGKANSDYKKCIDIATRAALREMLAPGLLVVLTPLFVGLLFGVETLAGLLAGSLASGVVLAISKANAGGAWDNAKKYIEAGHHGGKGSSCHHAAVVGDMVGDPFKDTSGPGLNILLKLMAILSLVFVPLFVKYGGLLLRFL